MAKKVEVEIGITGEPKYNQSIKNITASQKALQTEMKVLAQTFNGQANTVAALQSKYDNLNKQYELQSAKVDRYAASLEKAKTREAEASAKVVETKKAYDDAVKELDRLKDSSEASAEAIEDQQKEVEKLNTELAGCVSALDNAATATGRAEARYNSADAELKALDRDLQTTGQALEEAKNSTDGVAHSLDEYGTEVQEAETQTNSFGTTMLGVFTAQALYDGLKNLVSGIKDIASACIETGMQFESSMSNVKALSGATAQEMDVLSAKAKEMGATTMFSASQAADAFGYMALAGWDTESMLSGIEPVLSLAAAANMDLAEASDIVTDYLTAFGLSAQDAGKFADQMAFAMANSNTTVELLGESYKNCAATATSMGFSVEDVTAALMTMANAGVKGGEAGTGLNSIMTRLATNTKGCCDTLEKYNIEVYDSQGNLNSLSSILNGMAGIWDSLTDKEQANLAKTIAGQQQYSKLQTVMAGLSDQAKENGMSFNDYTAALETCNGAASDMAATMQDNLQGKLTILESALDALKESTYETFDDALKEGVEGATEAVSRLNDAVANGELGASLERLGQAGAELMDEVIDDLIEALPGIIEGMTGLVENAELIGTALTTLISTWAAYKVSAEAATIATQLLNAELSVNPAFAAAAAVAFLGNAMVGFAKNAADTHDKELKLTKQTTALVSETKDLTKSVRESRDAFKQSQEDTGATAEACKGLADQLAELQNKYADAIPGTEEFNRGIFEQQSVINQLNAAYPSLGLSINSATGELNQQTAEIYANIEAMRAQAEQAAIQERMTEIAKQRIEIETQKFKLEKEAAEQDENRKSTLDELTTAQERHNKAVDEGRAYNEGTAEAVDQAREAHIEAAHVYAQTQEQIALLNDENAELAEEEIYLTEKVAENSKAFEKNSEAINSEQSLLEKLGMTEEEFKDFFDAVNDSIDKQISLFEKHEEAASVSAETLRTNLSSQVDAMQKWADDFQKLAEAGVDDGLLKQMAEMGPQAQGYMDGLLQMVEEGTIQEYSEKWAAAVSLKDETRDRIIESYADAGEAIADGSVDSTVEELEDRGSEIAEASETAIEEAKEAGAEKAEEYADVGEQAMDSTKEGIESKESSVTGAVKTVGESALKTANSTMGKEQFIPVGKNIAAGIAEGIQQGTSSVVNQIKAMAAQAVQEAEKSLKIESPSKVFRQIGNYTMEGMAEGVKDTSYDVIGAVNQTMKEISAAGASVATSPSQLDTVTLGEMITRAIENGLSNFTLNVNADVDRDAIVKITVDNDQDCYMRKGVGQYV